MSSQAPPIDTAMPGGKQITRNAQRRGRVVAAARAENAIWPVVLLLYAILLPRELRIDLGGLVFFADRMVAFAMLPFLLRSVFTGALRFRLPDAIILLAGSWMVLAMMRNYGFASGIERGGALALDMAIGYFLARLCIKSTRDLQRVLVVYAPGLALAGGAMLAESLLSREIVQPIAEAIFGRLPTYLSGEAVGFVEDRQQFRLGFMRAAGPFPHPILGGLFLASMFSLYFWSTLRGWPKFAGIFAAACSFFSLSSAAILGLLMAFAFVGYDWIQQRVQNLSWGLVGIAGLVAAIVLQILSQGGIVYVIVRYLTLNPATGYFRQLIWEYGLVSVRANPLFGIGFQGYERPIWMLTESVDAHWLLLAIRYGVPVAVLVLLLGAWAIYALSRASVITTGSERQAIRSLAMAIGVILLMAFTVALNGGINAWFMIMTGAGITIAARLQDGSTSPVGEGSPLPPRYHNAKRRRVGRVGRAALRR